MTPREQALADALETAYSHLEMDKLRISHSKDANIIDKAVMLAKFPSSEGCAAQSADPDGDAFRTAARLGMTLRFDGGVAQSATPGTPSTYEVVNKQDRAEGMRQAVSQAAAVIAAGGESHNVSMAKLKL